MITEVPGLVRARRTTGAPSKGLHAEALVGTEDEILAKTTAALVHRATFSTLRAT